MKEQEIRDFFFKALSTYGLKYGKKELSVEGLRIDIFAVDRNHIPYIIEFKKEKNRHIVGQAAQYLSLIPTFNEQIEKEINFYDIKWDKLMVLCIAPDFMERDHKAAEYAPLRGKVHFYTFKILQNSRKQIFSLNLAYNGPDKNGPLIIPQKIIDKYDIKQISEEFSKIEKKEAKREYYSKTILPLLNEIGSNMHEFTEHGLFQHNSYWGKWFTLRFGTDKIKAHRASIELNFSSVIVIGFDLTHSLNEGTCLSKIFHDKEKRDYFIEQTLGFTDYDIHIPNTGINIFIPIKWINRKGLEILLQAYNPKKRSDCYFRIVKNYDKDSITIKDAVNILKDEYSKFKYIFELLNMCGDT